MISGTITMTDSEVTVQLLRDIRDQLVGTNRRIDDTNRRLDDGFRAVNERIDMTNERLAIVETTVRDCAQQGVMVGRYVKNRTDRHEDAIDDLRERVTRLETEKAP
jgi:hypothetical protein